MAKKKKTKTLGKRAGNAVGGAFEWFRTTIADGASGFREEFPTKKQRKKRKKEKELAEARKAVAKASKGLGGGLV